MSLSPSSRQSRIAAALSFVVTLVCLMLVGAPTASAHTELVSASPAPGKRVVAAGSLSVVLTFTDAIDPAFANLVLVDSAGNVAATEPSRVDGVTVTLVTSGVPEPGDYVVRFRVVSADGHPVDGETGFRVAAPKPAPSDPSPAPTPEESEQPGPGADPTPAADGNQAGSTPNQATAADEALDDGIGRAGLVVGLSTVVAALALLGVLARRRGARSGSEGA